MKGMVVYQSKWGNSRQIAEAIAGSLAESGHEAEAVSVKSAGSPDPSLDFIVLGGPTRAAHAYGPIKRFAKSMTGESWKGKRFATFSTGASIPTEKPSTQASERIHEMLEANGLKPLAPPFKAGVQGMHGPLVEGDLERAAEFGKELGGILSEKA
jgi:flavodoxin